MEFCGALFFRTLSSQTKQKKSKKNSIAAPPGNNAAAAAPFVAGFGVLSEAPQPLPHVYGVPLLPFGGAGEFSKAKGDEGEKQGERRKKN